jgi:glycine cleavage system H protein
MSDIPAELRYSQDHLWARRDAGTDRVRVGITDFAQQSLGDVVDVTLPQLGDAVTAGQACGEIESTKSVNDLVAPVSGTVNARNDELTNSPDLINADPYGRGWMFDIDVDPSAVDRELASLMDGRAYGDVAGS